MKKAPSTDSPYSRKADPRVLMSDMVGDLCPVGVMRDGGEASPILDWMMRFDFLPAIVDKGARWGIPRDADGRRRFALELLAIVCRGASRAPAADGSVPELVVELRAALRRADTVHEPVPVVLIRAGADGNTIELLHADAGAAKCIALAGEDVRAMLRRVVDTE